MPWRDTQLRRLLLDAETTTDGRIEAKPMQRLGKIGRGQTIQLRQQLVIDRQPMLVSEQSKPFT